MKTLVTSFATDKSGTVSIEHGLAIVGISLGLVVIIGHIGRQLNVLSKMVFTAERRRGRAPSDQILARSCAVIDLLIRSGHSEAQAIQVVTKRMLAVGIPPSLGKGHDVAGWKCLQQWRANLLEGAASEAARAEYHLFARQLENLPTCEVLEKELWDRRRAPLSWPISA
jgi:Flp pilus assembly pilin Flp